MPGTNATQRPITAVTLSAVELRGCNVTLCYRMLGRSSRSLARCLLFGRGSRTPLTVDRPRITLANAVAKRSERAARLCLRVGRRIVQQQARRAILARRASPPRRGSRGAGVGLHSRMQVFGGSRGAAGGGVSAGIVVRGEVFNPVGACKSGREWVQSWGLRGVALLAGRRQGEDWRRVRRGSRGAFGLVI